MYHHNAATQIDFITTKDPLGTRSNWRTIVCFTAARMNVLVSPMHEGSAGEMHKIWCGGAAALVAIIARITQAKSASSGFKALKASALEIAPPARADGLYAYFECAGIFTIDLVEDGDFLGVTSCSWSTILSHKSHADSQKAQSTIFRTQYSPWTLASK